MTGSIKVQNKAYGTAEIHIEGIIGTPEGLQFDDPAGRVATYDGFQKSLAQIREVRAKRVIVNIRSTGGAVSDALLIHDALVGLNAQIVTRCYGYTASAATIIAQAASRGCREISANALYLIHRAMSASEGNAGEMAQVAEMLIATDGRLVEIYSKRSGRNAREFTKLMGENGGSGRWLSPKEAISHGLADKMIDPSKAMNSATTNDASALNFAMNQIFNILKTKNLQTMATKKTEATGLMARVNKLISNAAKFLSPSNFAYEDAEGNVLFSTASETDDLAVGMEVSFPDDTTGGTFELPDGRIVTIEDFVVTSIDEATSEEVENLRAENEALKAQLAEAVNLVEEMKGQITSNYEPKARVSIPTTASRSVKASATSAKSNDVIKNEIKESHAAGFARRNITMPRK